jgi:preprotein translocase subunit SecF
MNKRWLHHLWTKLRFVKPWYFLILAIVSGIICIFALRANNEHMIKLRDAVYTADQNNTDVQQTLQQLQAYVTTHMSTSTSVYPPIQLKYTYDRLEQAESDAATAANTQLYTNAQTYCQQQDSVDFSGHNRVPCIEQYVETHDTQLAPIPDALYKFDFVSPTWSPDLAGWTLLLTIVTAILFVITFAASFIAKLWVG